MNANMDGSYHDDGFDSFVSQMSAASGTVTSGSYSELSDFYKAKNDDFLTQSQSDKKSDSENGYDKANSELLDSSLERELRGTFNKRNKHVEDVSGKFAVQFLLPDWIYKDFLEQLQKIPRKTLTGVAGFVLIAAILGIAMMLSKDEWTRLIGACVLVFLASLISGVAGSWILVQEVYKKGVDEEEFEAQVSGIGLWENTKKKGGININTAIALGTQGKSMDEISVVAPGSLDYLATRFKIRDPEKERQLRVQMGLGFIWLGLASFIACGYVTALTQLHTSHAKKEISEVQTTLVGVAGWIVVAGAIGGIYQNLRRSSS